LITAFIQYRVDLFPMSHNDSLENWTFGHNRG